LKQEEIKAIYSSPLQRALYTAQAIARHHHLEVQIEPALKELNVGELEGVLVSMLGRRLDELLTMPVRDEIDIETGEGVWDKLRHIGGESLDELQQRVWGAIQNIASRHSDGVIVVVSHYFVILTIICAVLNLPVSQIGRFRLGAGSISTIVFDKPVPRLTLFGDICHLIRP
jgi:probable phosphoglycerate mutase